ncbi:hypothetical protein CC80DRAFT_266982 [Byssothecium circinans]|uniref:Peptidase A1 domain-containing protein n=1 Tax=Byssothecium circinans TaxID=147558 RepID=A0A6A5U7K0_9PLEO|nr:hypothetical protein CC80DRAFT_266982 [Byssothecium circinans]
MRLRKRADNVNSTTVPAPPKPYVLPASNEWDGNDGKWSTFLINLGDDEHGRGQNFRVLVSTSSPVTIVPGQSDWCNQECSKERGTQLFDNKQTLGFEDKSSYAWNEAGLFNIPLPHWWSMNKTDAKWGSENVGLGPSSTTSPILAKQNVLLGQDKNLFMGSLGLSNVAVISGKDSKSGFLVNFAKSAEMIPSVSYGYSAGASYRNGESGAAGSVVLGGYDRSRAKLENSFSTNMPPNNSTLVVGVTSITYQPNQDIHAITESLTANSSGFLATIDSTLPYLWLPDKICDAFIERFQLSYNEKTELYTVNETAHEHNQRQNATVLFKLSKDALDSNNYTTISLPYAAFDLEASYPIYDNATRYFPIKKSRNGIFVLGRTFLQESYLIVDYERSNFTIAPAIYTNPMPEQKLVPIYNKTYTPPAATLTPIPKGDKGLPGGAIAGIVVGILIAIGLAAVGAFFWWKKRRTTQEAPPYSEKPQEIDTEVAGTEVKHRRVSELDSEPRGPNSPKPSLGGYYDRDAKDISPFPPISEMESPPAELYSPPLMTSTPRTEEAGSDYFMAGNKVRRRGATRESSGNNTPGTPAAIAELPGDDGQYQVGGVHFEPVLSPKLNSAHLRGASDTSLGSNIDEVVGRPGPSPEPGTRTDTRARGESQPPLEGVKEEGEDAPLERRPSHTRGLSDTTVQSEDTAVSALTPEEMEQWALGDDNEPRRPLSE